MIRIEHRSRLGHYLHAKKEALQFWLVKLIAPDIYLACREACLIIRQTHYAKRLAASAKGDAVVMANNLRRLAERKPEALEGWMADGGARQLIEEARSAWENV